MMPGTGPAYPGTGVGHGPGDWPGSDAPGQAQQGQA